MELKMKNIVYDKMPVDSEIFDIDCNSENQIIGLKNSFDRYGMNWLKGKKTWGEVLCNFDLSARVTREYTKQHTLVETYVFKNETDFDIYTMGTSLGICTPFPDYYTDAAACMTNCCHTHIWCGGNSSYIMALRMGGEAPHLGLVLKAGSLQGYSVKRMETTSGREEELSNHRGDFILHPVNLHLKPGETYTVSWELFWFKDKREFKERLLETPNFIHVQAEAYVLLEGETLQFSVKMNADNRGSTPVIMENGKRIEYTFEDGEVKVKTFPLQMGEYNYEIIWNGKKTRASFIVISQLDKLAERRCHFIADYQQCNEKDSYLDGAYLVYDNEEHQQFYSHVNDHNGGRERVGMAALLACYLQHHPDDLLMKSLDKYMEYFLRELFDETTGEVFNDAPRCGKFKRLYNYPMVSCMLLEVYLLKKDERYLDRYYKSAEAFYQAGGARFYALCLPMYESVKVFREAGRIKEAEKLLAFYREQGDFIVECGKKYPAHEVDYEQSIVAPAAIYLKELYSLTGETKYKEAAKEQCRMLDLFQGEQPDYHLNEVAIRHWDGYWFGKRKCLGDTFPHYWSALSGCAYLDSEKITDTKEYAKKAEKSLRGVLSLFWEDGSASCAMVYPMSVNGKEANYYDPWANDQDWGLYFALKYLNSK